MENSHTTVRVRVDTHERLEDARRKGECYDETIRRIMSTRTGDAGAIQ